MTTWQFEFGFIPSTQVTRHWALSRSSIRVSPPDREELWKAITWPDSLIESLDKLLSGSEMIGASCARWGNKNGNFIDVFFELNRLVDIAVTLDLRTPCLMLVSELALLANQHQWLVVTTDGRVFRPTLRCFLREIQQSPARRWVKGSLDAFVQRHATRGNDELRCD